MLSNKLMKLIFVISNYVKFYYSTKSAHTLQKCARILCYV